jgi:hypothetical protein
VRRYTLNTLTYPGRWPVVLANYAELLAAIENAEPERAGEIVGPLHVGRLRHRG